MQTLNCSTFSCQAVNFLINDILVTFLEWYYGENLIFPIEAILKLTRPQSSLSRAGVNWGRLMKQGMMGRRKGKKRDFPSPPAPTRASLVNNQ